MTIRIQTSIEDTIQQMSHRISGFRFQEIDFRNEICSAFNVDILSTVHVKFSAHKGLYLEEGLQPIFDDDSLQEDYDKCIDYITTLCKRHHEFEKEINNDVDQFNAEDPSQIRRQIKRKRNPHAPRNESTKPYLVP